MQPGPLTRANLKTPKAAAIAGMVLSVLLIGVFRTSIPADPQESGSWLQSNSGAVALALNLMPFVGIAFLWFIGVLRDRLGEKEDRFFATVFFGSGVLFSRHAVHRGGNRGRYPDRLYHAAPRADRFVHVSLRPGCGLQPGERIHDQDG